VRRVVAEGVEIVRRGEKLGSVVLVEEDVEVVASGGVDGLD